MVTAPRSRNESAAPGAEAMASFRFVGQEIDSALITEHLQIEPSAACPPADVGPRARPRRPVKTWRLDSGIPETEPLGKHLAALIEVLSPVRQQLHELVKESGWSPTFNCDYFFSGDQGGGIELPSHTLEAIAALGATIDLRVYPDQES